MMTLRQLIAKLQEYDDVILDAEIDDVQFYDGFLKRKLSIDLIGKYKYFLDIYIGSYRQESLEV